MSETDVVKRRSIAYQCWQQFGIDENHMLPGVCPICSSELQRGEENRVMANVGAHLTHSHKEFLQEHGIEKHKKVPVAKVVSPPVIVKAPPPAPREEGHENGASIKEEIQNASLQLAAKFSILKSAIGCPDAFFTGKKILDIDVYVTPRMEGDVVHVQMNYIDLTAKPQQEKEDATT